MPTDDDLLRSRAWITSVCRRFGTDESASDDLAQELWLAHHHRPPARGSSLRAWSTGVLRRLSLMERRRRGREARRLERAARPSETPSVIDEILTRERGRRVRAAVRGLPEPYRSTVVRVHFDGIAPSEVAREQGVRPSTVRARLTRAREMLRQHLGADRGSAGLARLIAILRRTVTTRGVTSGAPLAAGLVLAALAVLGSDRGAPGSPSRPTVAALPDRPPPARPAPITHVSTTSSTTTGPTTLRPTARASSTSWGSGSSTSHHFHRTRSAVPGGSAAPVAPPRPSATDEPEPHRPTPSGSP